MGNPECRSKLVIPLPVSGACGGGVALLAVRPVAAGSDVARDPGL